MEPDNVTPRKGILFGNHEFQVPCQSFVGVVSIRDICLE